MSSIATRHAGPAGQVNAAVTTAQIFPLISNPNMPCTVSAKGKGIAEQKRFTIRAEGNLQTAGATTTAQASLLAGLAIPATPLVIGSWTLLGAGGAQVVATAWSPWWIEANLILDSNSGKMQGTFSQMVNNLYTAWAPLANQLTGINATNNPIAGVQPADPVAWFAIALTFSVANAGNIGNLANFELQS